jgi:hypothetical protein
MASYNLKFCSAFGYASCVCDHFARIVDRILESAPFVESILVVGSAARGELSYLDTDEDFRLFSDYEFLLLTRQNVDKAGQYSLGLDIDQLGHRLNPASPLFHVDLTWYEIPRLPRLKRTIAVFEQKATGKVIFGQDRRHLMPDVTAQNLDRKNANEILYKRLWALLLYLPQEFFESCLTTETMNVTTYVLARNALDLTTVLLPYEGVLLPSYVQRVEHVAADYTSLQLGTAFGADFPQFLRTCLASRNTLSWKGSLIELYTRVVGYLELALRYVLARQGRSVDDTSRALTVQSPLIFDEVLPKRAEVRRALRVLWGRRSLRQALQWPGLAHKGLLTACLLHMHRSMIAHLNGNDSRALASMESARSLLDMLASRPLSPWEPDEPFIHRWLALRRDCGYFWWEFVRKRTPVFYRRIWSLTAYE